MSLFMVGGQGLNDLGTKSWILLFFYLEVVPDAILKFLFGSLKWLSKDGAIPFESYSVLFDGAILKFSIWHSCKRWCNINPLNMFKLVLTFRKKVQFRNFYLVHLHKMVQYKISLSWFILIYSSWHRMSHFLDFHVFWPLFGLKHLVWGSHFVTSKVTMPKLTLRRKFHWKMPYFWVFYHSKLRRRIIHFFKECISYYFYVIKSIHCKHYHMMQILKKNV